MIEQKLRNAADAMPEPLSDFTSVEERTKKKKQPKKSAPKRRRRLAIVLSLAVLLVGCVAASAPDYHLYNGSWWNFIPGLFFDPAEEFGLHDDQTMKAAEKLGITLPETLGGYPIISYGRWNLTNQDVPIWWAWLSPRYVYQSTYYGMEVEVPHISPDGTEGTLHTAVGADVTYGPTDDEIWRRQFGYDENDVFVASNWTLASHPVAGITTLEYEGITIYVGQIDLPSYVDPNWTKWDVTWVDYANGVVFSMDGDAETPDVLIECAKEIIDLNK